MIHAISRIVRADSVEAVWSILTETMAPYGFDRLLYGLTRFRTPNSLGNPEDMMILSNHSDAYVEGFLGDAMFKNAPMVAWASQNVGAMSWSWLSENAETLTARQQEIVAFNRSHDVVAGYTISFPDSSSRQKAAIALTARRGMSQQDVDAVWAEHGEDIDLVNQVAHLKMTALPAPEALRSLSGRQREVLEWVSDGKTVADIAIVMGLRPATVEKHLRLAREALQVETTAQAVMKASLQKQIFVLQD